MLLRRDCEPRQPQGPFHQLSKDWPRVRHRLFLLLSSLLFPPWYSIFCRAKHFSCHCHCSFPSFMIFLSASGTVFTATRTSDSNIVAIKQMNLAQQPKKVHVQPAGETKKGGKIRDFLLLQMHIMFLTRALLSTNLRNLSLTRYWWCESWSRKTLSTTWIVFLLARMNYG